jgi:hypothetical protein
MDKHTFAPVRFIDCVNCGYRFAPDNSPKFRLTIISSSTTVAQGYTAVSQDKRIEYAKSPRIFTNQIPPAKPGVYPLELTRIETLVIS